MADWGVPAAPGVEAEAGCMTGGGGSGFPEANSAKSGICRNGERADVGEPFGRSNWGISM